MIAIDTNVVVRILVDDEPAAVARAKRLLEGNRVFVPHSVLMETEWVLRSTYGYSKDRIVHGLTAFLGLHQVEVTDKVRLAEAMEWWAEGMDLADALHLIAAADCDSLATFDRQFIRAAAHLNARPTVAAP
ncbi:type II toxin-antitoxin system VapC family toxin [Phreatobacter sp. HK31-P]